MRNNRKKYDLDIIINNFVGTEEDIKKIYTYLSVYGIEVSGIDAYDVTRYKTKEFKIIEGEIFNDTSELIPEYCLEYANWEMISKYSKIDKQFILKYKDKLNWYWLNQRREELGLSDEFIKSNRVNVNRIEPISNRTMLENILKKEKQVPEEIQKLNDILKSHKTNYQKYIEIKNLKVKTKDSNLKELLSIITINRLYISECLVDIRRLIKKHKLSKENLIKIFKNKKKNHNYIYDVLFIIEHNDDVKKNLMKLRDRMIKNDKGPDAVVQVIEYIITNMSVLYNHKDKVIDILNKKPLYSILDELSYIVSKNHKKLIEFNYKAIETKEEIAFNEHQVIGASMTIAIQPNFFPSEGFKLRFSRDQIKECLNIFNGGHDSNETEKIPTDQLYLVLLSVIDNNYSKFKDEYDKIFIGTLERQCMKNMLEVCGNQLEYTYDDIEYCHDQEQLRKYFLDLSIIYNGMRARKVFETLNILSPNAFLIHLSHCSGLYDSFVNRLCSAYNINSINDLYKFDTESLKNNQYINFIAMNYLLFVLYIDYILQETHIHGKGNEYVNKLNYPILSNFISNYKECKGFKDNDDIFERFYECYDDFFVKFLKAIDEDSDKQLVDFDDMFRDGNMNARIQTNNTRNNRIYTKYEDDNSVQSYKNFLEATFDKYIKNWVEMLNGDEDAFDNILEEFIEKTNGYGTVEDLENMVKNYVKNKKAKSIKDKYEELHSDLTDEQAEEVLKYIIDNHKSILDKWIEALEKEIEGASYNKMKSIIKMIGKRVSLYKIDIVISDRTGCKRSIFKETECLLDIIEKANTIKKKMRKIIDKYNFKVMADSATTDIIGNRNSNITKEPITIFNYKKKLIDMESYDSHMWDYIAEHYNLTIEFIFKFKDKLSLEKLMKNPYFNDWMKNDDFFDRYIEDITKLKEREE